MGPLGKIPPHPPLQRGILFTDKLFIVKWPRRPSPVPCFEHCLFRVSCFARRPADDWYSYCFPRMSRYSIGVLVPPVAGLAVLIREKPKTVMITQRPPLADWVPGSPRIRGFGLPTTRRKDTLPGPSRVSFISPQWVSGLGVPGTQRQRWVSLARGNFGLGLTISDWGKGRAPRHAPTIAEYGKERKGE